MNLHSWLILRLYCKGGPSTLKSILFIISMIVLKFYTQCVFYFFLARFLFMYRKLVKNGALLKQQRTYRFQLRVHIFYKCVSDTILSNKAFNEFWCFYIIFSNIKKKKTYSFEAWVLLKIFSKIAEQLTIVVRKLSNDFFWTMCNENRSRCV